jgi:plasmid replication initiation protein
MSDVSISKSKYDFFSIKQHNLITEACYEMSALQKNIFYLLLAQVKDENAQNNKYKLSLKQLENIRSIRVRREELLEAARGLIASGLTIRSSNQERFATIGILHSADYGVGESKDVLMLEIDARLNPFLYHVKNKFTIFTLAHALDLKSKYSKRIYEMLCQFKDTGIFKISVLRLKERLGLINLETGKENYLNFGEFARKVLEVAKREINEQTDINFEYITEKTGKKITELEFHITYESANTKAILAKSIPIVQKEISQKESVLRLDESKVVPQINQISEAFTSEKKEGFKPLPSEQVEVYWKLINSPKKNGLGWLKGKEGKALAYALVTKISVDSIHSHISKIKIDINNSELNYSISEYFKEILNSRNQKVQSNIKEKVKNIDEPSSLEIQNSVEGRYYKKMNLEFGINLLTIAEIAKQVSFDILKEAIDQISQEDLQKQKSLSDKSNYVLNRLINELRLDLNQK